MPRWLNLTLTTLTVGFLVGLIVAPYALSVLRPNGAQYFSEIAVITTPWIVIFLILALFAEGIKTFVSSLSNTLNRLILLKWGSASADFSLGQNNIVISRSDAEGIVKRFNFESRYAWRFFILYINESIFRSQYDLMLSLKDTEHLNDAAVTNFYSDHVQRVPKGKAANYEKWLSYLIENMLVQKVDSAEAYEITNQGRVFVEQIVAHGNPDLYSY